MTHEHELELELEQEMEGELEGEFEGEGEGEGEGEHFLGPLIQGVTSLLGEGEGEGEGFLEGEGEFEHELEGEGFLEGEGEFELEHEHEHELEGEFEHEQFFGKIGGLLRRAAPLLKRVARVAVPMVAKTVGGPFGGILGQLAGSFLSEHEREFEHELEGEGFLEGEGEFEHEHEHEHEHELETEHEAMAEMMAAQAAMSEHEHEAEALAGGAAALVVSARDRRALRRVLPHMIRGVSILARLLRRRRATRPFVRALPSVVKNSVRSLKRGAAAGRPITRRAAARVMAANTKRLLTKPHVCAAAMRRNVRLARRMARPRRVVRG